MRNTLMILAALAALVLGNATVAIANEHQERPDHNPNPPCENPGAAGDRNPHCPEGPPGRQQEPEQDPVELGTVAGVVTDAETGAAVEGAEVTAVAGVDDAAAETATVVTGADGAYELGELDVGSYDVTVDAEGFESATEDDVEVAGDETAEVNFELVSEDVSDDGEEEEAGDEAVTTVIADFLMMIEEFLGIFVIEAA